MKCIRRSNALRRTETLIGSESAQPYRSYQTRDEALGTEQRTGLALCLFQASLSMRPALIWSLSVISGMLLAFAVSRIVAPFAVPLFFLGGALLPFLWVEARIRSRASSFSQDYPSILLATSSSIKAGLTPYRALERSIHLLPDDSLVRKEIEQLMNDLQRGVPKERALQRFAQSIRQPELELFRTGFALVIDHGGKFAPTLERLAKVTKDRSSLIHAAMVSTATMRMTATILLLVTPLFLLLLSSRSNDFWDTLLNHPIANGMATVGFVTIAVAFAVLNYMSHFKP